MLFNIGGLLFAIFIYFLFILLFRLYQFLEDSFED